MALPWLIGAAAVVAAKIIYDEISDNSSSSSSYSSRDEDEAAARRKAEKKRKQKEAREREEAEKNEFLEISARFQKDLLAALPMQYLSVNLPDNAFLECNALNSVQDKLAIKEFKRAKNLPFNTATCRNLFFLNQYYQADIELLPNDTVTCLDALKESGEALQKLYSEFENYRTTLR